MANLRGTPGSDTLTGTSGDDILEDYDGGDDVLLGLGGNDNLTIYRGSQGAPNDVRLEGGDGDDRIWVTLYNGARVEILGGAGDDLVTVSRTQGSVRITTGSGRDSIDFNHWQPGQPPLTVTDFASGPGGDRILWTDFVDHTLEATTGGNPFASGHVRLVQDGAHSLFQIRFDGTGDWRTCIVFENTDAAAFTADNFDGYPPSGAAVAGQTLNGSTDADSLGGTRWNDVISGLDGNDRLWGYQGDDLLDGGDGNDFLDGQEGSDVLRGGSGDDELTAGRSGADVLLGGDGADILDAYRDPDALALSVSLSGEAGDDTIYVSLHNGAAAMVDGGSGDDAIVVGSGGLITITTGSGADTVTYGKYALLPPRLTITDFEIGLDVVDLKNFTGGFQGGFYGLGDSNPFLFGYARLVRDGDDLVIQLDRDGRGDGFVEAVRFENIGDADLGLASIGFQALSFDHTGGAGDDRLFGSYRADRLDGGGGWDVLIGGDGDDQLSGGERADQLSGDGGDDVLHGGAGDDTVDGGAGTDILRVSGVAGDYVLLRDGDDFILKGPDGLDHLTNVEFVEFEGGGRWDLARQYGAGGPLVLPPAPEDGGKFDGSPLVLPGDVGPSPPLLAERRGDGDADRQYALWSKGVETALDGDLWLF